MKTAISIPDDIFRAAEHYAKQTRKTRSRLYSEAVSEYLQRHAVNSVTDAMNRAIKKIGQPDDLFVRSAAERILERTEW